MVEKIAVLGAGSWGSMLANILVENGNEVRLWSYKQSQVDELNNKHTNEKYIKDFTYPKELVAYADMKEAIRGVDDILFVVPAQVTRSTAKQVNEILEELDMKVNIIHGSKGIEQKTYKRMSEVLADEIDESHRKSISVISGPSQAESVAKHDITLVTTASENIKDAEHIQSLFINDYFRVYTNDDIIGVEIGAALKNIIAIGAGALYGLGYADNAKAALMTRGLAEISRLGTSFGANPLTFTGLSGFGDVIVTATSSDSRNWRAGYQLGNGETLDDIVKNMGMVIEGIATAEAAYELANQRGIDMPITSAIYKVLHKEITIDDAISQLMHRKGRAELD
ncbi:glycerol-3-phosphate dehydrogenase [Apilactobacillus kunkeei]|uniref:NAD(P)H-dependent glycerol-3-phosphate dehydrogenase n=1 Tax=Apilactobacillus kunkeei TaxID=148814 RepID=UPI00059B514B|nr:NAD(P)H-dependent glycerol-3-phosphate dehydrogenase [Apilactobacillus kunkeei]KIM18857.1 glycerol-3-phosphate dehydrogenase [Apilactobacillus kunkeei]MBX8455301.1 NAD(P)H-dependent glycerol-3-phosphate dehydrogenase [Apilactobacillus kunkeei]QYU54825.1 NAD(P)H-dependent glycerol-3-phosphate dehydrogenase [Apilactobacillus kunkeei]CAI2577373.1 Glycerol-3-phosphate dehydrogenase [NAD(P)+] [Apilactobacillus kunkeei]CAI2577818.1 Glycerol-3-phosphate dehydrogenase [NAD(P)+] [Apilactobacillus ku